ncbi:hypothetical protein A2U01_0046716 [Trifolium medium]|uniref:Uncharacterized protein n=1 Tax=Trifolium medium TaxID=97028 RepID=A0A392QQG9_9FABA|nr:hypothetical protein [Trifolium medium]
MKRGNSKTNAQEKKKRPEKKLKFKQDESSESGKTDSDYAEFLKTYDPNEESTGYDEEVTQKLPWTKESKKKDSKLPESVQDSN